LLFLAEPAQEGDLIVEYVGVFTQTLQGHNEYSMTVPGGFLVAAARENDSRFINHLCCGNVVPTVWIVHGEFRVGVFAAKGIEAGEEVKMDYSWEHLGGERTTCNCGEPECRGELGAPPEGGRRRGLGEGGSRQGEVAGKVAQHLPRLRDSKGKMITLRPETIAGAPCSTREQELLEDGSKLGTPRKGGAQSRGMEGLTDEQWRKLEAHLAEKQEALEEKKPKGGRGGGAGLGADEGA
jgi:hypothetical protein